VFTAIVTAADAAAIAAAAAAAAAPAHHHLVVRLQAIAPQRQRGPPAVAHVHRPVAVHVALVEQRISKPEYHIVEDDITCQGSKPPVAVKLMGKLNSPLRPHHAFRQPVAHAHGRARIPEGRENLGVAVQVTFVVQSGFCNHDITISHFRIEGCNQAALFKPMVNWIQQV
jgi:hypothetical protein